MLDLKDAIVTADAMSCQTKISAKITEKESDYVIGLKGNQSALLSDVKLYFENFISEFAYAKTQEKGRGRIEKREYFLSAVAMLVGHKKLVQGGGKMYKFDDGQISIHEFGQPIGMKLHEDNRWVKKAMTIPYFCGYKACDDSDSDDDDDSNSDCGF